MEYPKTACIIGGSSGLGLSLCNLLQAGGSSVYFTGRSAKNIPLGCSFIPLDITNDAAQLTSDLSVAVSELPHLDLLVYAAGFMECGHIDDLGDAHILKMIHVGLTAPMFLMQRVLAKQSVLDGFIAITSTSALRAREFEPTYTAVKAGLTMFSESIALDPRVKKVLSVGPSGMNTHFWASSGRDTGDMLSPHTVAEQVLALWDAPYKWRKAQILRAPMPESERLQVLETRIS